MDFPAYMDISSIFNVSNLYPYKGDNVEEPTKIQENTKRWRHKLPRVKPSEIDTILD